MPVPSCNLHGNPLRFKLGGQQASGYRIKQDDQPSNKMDSMRAGEDVKQRTAWIGSQKGSLRAEDIPYQNLSSKKTKTQKDGNAEPWQVALKSRRYDSHSGKLFFFNHGAASQFKCQAADQQDYRICPQLQIRKAQGNPVADPA